MNNKKMYLNIAYIILTKQNEITFTNHYIKQHIENQNIINQILKLPKDVAEIYLSKEEIINMRMTGLIDGYHIYFFNSIDDIYNINYKTKFIIVSDLCEVETIYKKIIEVPFVLLSEKLETNEKYNLYNFRDLTIEKFQDIFEKMLLKQDEQMINYCEQLKKHTFTRNNSNLCINTDIALFKNIYTLSNINTLSSLRTNFKITNNVEDVNIDKNTELSINLINKIKNEIFNNLKTYKIEEANYYYDYIISDLSNNLDFLINKNHYTKHKLKDKGYEYFELIADALKFLKNYDFKSQYSKKILNNKYIKEYLEERNYIEQLISVIAASFVTPNIKLPIKENKYISILKEIGNIDRLSQNSNKINKAFQKLEKQFNEDIKDWFDYMNCETSKRLKLVSNLPLEWITHCELPLMIKHDVSRIPVSPGYLTEKLLLDTEQIHLSINDFKKILFISSFQDNDPIKNDIKEKIKIMRNMLSKPLDQKFVDSLLNNFEPTKDYKIQDNPNKKINIEIEWVNVANQDELIKTLNKNNSVLTIFDLHGGHSQNGEGFISLKEENIPISSLINKVKIPPIIILSACDTSPIDKNHYNVANMFLLAGAKTVLASALPILSHEASNYIARLLVRLSIYIYQHVIQYKKSIRWSTFVSGMTRQMYYTELLDKLEKAKIVTNKQKYELLYIINMNLNPLQLNFHNKIINEISKKTNKSIEEIKTFIKINHKFAECLKYIQIGNPENIIIIPNS
ncbi:hypothetical protein [Caminibacter pacificus]